jgi:NAD(P)-dependent dehydrogenase (short-subunit alcohol dehydrogenase family)
LAEYADSELEAVFAVNTLAPLALLQVLLPCLRARRGRVINISSDAAVEAYEGWGGYGASKAALDHISATLAVEQPDLRVYAFDPGDMRTDMQQAAFPGEDISDRPPVESVLPSLLRLVDEELASGRYRVGGLAHPGPHR